MSPRNNRRHTESIFTKLLLTNFFFYLCLVSVACRGCKDEPSSGFVDGGGGGSHIDSQENVAQGVLSGCHGTEGFNL